MPLIGMFARLDRGGGSRLPVLMYHRVADEESQGTLDPRLLSATPAEFEEQLEYLASTRTVLSLQRLLEVRRGEAPLPQNPVVITFDDAYVDFADTAWPILQKYGAPVTLFVPTGFPESGRRYWWDELFYALSRLSLPARLGTPVGTMILRTHRDLMRALDALTVWVRHTPHDAAMAEIDAIVGQIGAHSAASDVLSWPHLRALAAAGVALAPHSRTHPMLNQVPLDRAAEEILGSARDLEREIGTSPPVFSLPAGGHSAELVQWLASSPFEVVFTTTRGNNDINAADWHRLRRINVGRRTVPPLLGMQFLSWFPQRRDYENAHPMSSLA